MERKEILFDNFFYDVTDFIRKHPGGRIIQFYTESGEDSTHAIQQFHQRSITRVKSIMKSFKKRAASDSEIGLDVQTLRRNRALTEDFTKLYLELENEGLFKPSYTHIILRIFDFVVLGYVAYSLFKMPHIAAKIVGIVLYGIWQGRFGWLGHENGHNSYTGNPKLERILHAIVFGVGIGMSSTWWKHGHNRHHSMPQRLNRDVDLDTMPIMAYNAKVVKNHKDFKGFMLQNQVYLFPLIDTLLGILLWRLYLHPRFVIRHKLYLELIAIIGHFVLAYQIGFLPYIMATWFGSIYMFVNFALSHTFLPVTNEPKHWVEFALIHTADVDQRPWCSWWMGYLNFQIEHHLFPTMPQFRHPLIKDRVKALAEKHNLPYVVHSYPEAVRKTFQNLSDVVKEFQDSS